jgi:HNH endonuclease
VVSDVSASGENSANQKETLMTPPQLEYRDIDGFPGYRACSNGKITGKRVKFLKPTVQKDGYELVILMAGPWGSAKCFTRTVHGLICSAFHGKRPFPKAHARHRDGNKRNNVPDNLLWGTAKENYQDSVALGTRGFGDKGGNHKLSKDEVDKVKERLARGDNAKLIAKDFGVVFQSIYNIKAGITWK